MCRASRGKTRGEWHIAAQRVDRLTQRYRISGLDEKCGDVVLDDLGHTTPIACNEGTIREKRLHNDPTEWLGRRGGVHNDIARRHQLGNIIPSTENTYAAQQ